MRSSLARMMQGPILLRFASGVCCWLAGERRFRPVFARRKLIWMGLAGCLRLRVSPVAAARSPTLKSDVLRKVAVLRSRRRGPHWADGDRSAIDERRCTREQTSVPPHNEIGNSRIFFVRLGSTAKAPMRDNVRQGLSVAIGVATIAVATIAVALLLLWWMLPI
jgi:hypothetical protein